MHVARRNLGIDGCFPLRSIRPRRAWKIKSMELRFSLPNAFFSSDRIRVSIQSRKVTLSGLRFGTKQAGGEGATIQSRVMFI